MRGSRPLVLGLSYNENISDARESPSICVVQLLADLGADVRVVDSLVDSTVTNLHRPLMAQVALTRAEVEAADLTVLLVDNDAFDLSVLDAPRVLAPGSHVEIL